MTESIKRKSDIDNDFMSELIKETVSLNQLTNMLNRAKCTV